MKKRILYMLAVLTTLIYLFWRIFYTLPTGTNVIGIIFALLFLFVEIIGFIESLNSFGGMTAMKRPNLPVIPDDEFPEVDVFVSLTDNDAELIKKNLNACVNLDYPDKSKVHIFLCGAGIRKDAADICSAFGVEYITASEGASKTECLNHALSKTSSALVATIDADVIPMSDFLTALVPYFFLDSYEKTENGWKRRENPDKTAVTGFVQCPQSSYNCDMFQYNLFSETTVPNEQYFFFKAMQLSGNSSNTVVYAGSNALLSRQALKDAGGFYIDPETKELSTGLNIQSKGYRGYASGDIHASGLAATELSELFHQREYWAKSYLKAIKRMRILSNKSLSLYQKFSCLMGVSYWYKPIRQFVYILAPLLMSLLGIPVMRFSLTQLALIWLPYYIINSFALSYLSGRLRTKRLDNIYSTILFPRLIKSLFDTVFKRKESKNTTSRLSAALPYAVLLLLSTAGIGVSVYKCAVSGSLYWIAVIIWLLSNAHDLIMAISFAWGRKYMRRSERFYASVPLSIKFGDRTIDITTQNISDGGVSFSLKNPVYIPDNIPLALTLTDENGKFTSHITGQIAHVEQAGELWRYAIKFINVDEKNKLSLYSIIYNRVPTLPASVSYNTNIFLNIKKNVFVRNKHDVISMRKLPRLNIGRVFITDKYYKVKIVNFNYEYALILSNIGMFEDKMQIMLNDEGSLMLECGLDSYAKSYNKNIKKYGLYHVDNFRELVYNEEFNRLLYSWIDDYTSKHITPIYIWSKLTGQKNEFGEIKITLDEE